MSKIWRDIEITWEGESYTIRPTMAFINMLEQGDGMSLSMLFARILKRDIPVGQAAEVIARTLRFAGASVTSEDVYMQAGGLSTELVEVASIILAGCMPVDDEDEPAKKKPIKKKSAKLSGANSTL
jgi:hypothetical protein